MLANLGPEAQIARLDIKSAFRLLPIHISDFELLGFKIQDMFFIDKCLPFGCSFSCAKFEKFLTFLEWVFRDRSGCGYLDDFLLPGKAGSQDCAYLMGVLGKCVQS